MKAMSETKIDRKPLGKDASTRRRTSTANRHFRLRKKVAGTAETSPSGRQAQQPPHPRAAHRRPRRQTHFAAASRSRPTCVLWTATSHTRPKVGELIAARAKAAGVEAVVFDRGGKDYHGRIAALADAAREEASSL